MTRLGVNTVELPVYWEQVEPEPGRFDFSVVDMMADQARAHGVRLVLLWFGTWKNGSAHYRPTWAKRRPRDFPDLIGRDGKPVDSPSPFAEAALRADAHAFATVMGHLRSIDAQRTVIMVQVENEPGTWGAMRDFSPAAEKAFREPVPAAVLRAMGRPAGPGPDWRTAFGERADAFFHAWAVARYIERVAAAGRSAYPLPLYVNVALKDPFQAGTEPAYEYGGATFDAIPIWKATAPSIDLLAPDIYQRDAARYLAVLDQYRRPDNALFVPETIAAPDYARFLYAALGRGAIGYSPFGVDDVDGADGPIEPGLPAPDGAQLALAYHTIGPMMRQVAAWSYEGRLRAAIEDGSLKPTTLDLGPWTAEVRFGTAPRGAGGGNARPVGRMLVAVLSPDEFIVTGAVANIRFQPAGPSAGRPWQFLTVEEGSYVGGEFHATRILNGDETDWGLTFGSAPRVLRVRLMAK